MESCGLYLQSEALRVCIWSKLDCITLPAWPQCIAEGGRNENTVGVKGGGFVSTGPH